MTLTKAIKEYYKTFSQHGSANTIVEISPQEVALVICIAYFDIYNKYPKCADSSIIEIANKSYYNITEDDINKISSITIEQALEYFEETNAFQISDYTMYVNKLCTLHRRRFKYRTILENQPFPTVEQIGPRGLLEFGACENELLFNWMCWRKWIYDIDNRSAQETGYLFEPILVSCIGGETISHSKSPVKRISEDGNTKNEGRQIDCYIERGDKKYAYELKMRVTIAASGQGRFNEELTFPKEANQAGIKPVLFVFDPTRSALLTKLENAYLSNNGEVYIGDLAWEHLERDAGCLMGKFIEKYIKPAIDAMKNYRIDIPFNINLSATEQSIVISNQDKKYKIKRF